MHKKLIFGAGVGAIIFILAGFYVDSQMGKKSIVPSPSSTTQSKGAVDFKNYGSAPDFVGIDKWLNSDPLTIKALSGKVVLVDFWTYSCINCIRTLPYVTRWYDSYKDKGLVVVGVHTPEFAFEKETKNVQDAIKRFGIHYPVAQDNNYLTWNDYSNQYWPAEYLIDKSGKIVYVHFGEGNYDHTENAIRELLDLSDTPSSNNGENLSGVESPEIYFGTARLQYLTKEQTPSSDKVYILPSNIPLNNFGLEGKWQFNKESIRLLSNSAKIKLKFHSAKVHIVAQSDNSTNLKVIVDGKVQPSVTVQKSQLYTLFESDSYSDHVIEIQIDEAGFQAFTFTFG